MSVLHAAQRNALPTSTFAGPDRSFPIPDANHARAALSMAHYASNPAAIRAKVHAKFPSIGGAGLQRSAILKHLGGLK
jgi:hypothetical protein